MTGRVEYVGHARADGGRASGRDDSGFEFRPAFDVPVRVVEADARYSRGRLELRAQFAQVSIYNADQLNDALTRRTGVSPTSHGAARRLCSRPLPDRLGRAVRRRRRLHAVRERGHAVPDARGRRAAQGIRSRRDGWWAPRTGPTRTSPSSSTTSSRATAARSSPRPTRSTSGWAGGSDAKGSCCRSLVDRSRCADRRSPCMRGCRLPSRRQRSAGASAVVEMLGGALQLHAVRDQDHASATTLEIRLESDDTDHGFRIIGTDVTSRSPSAARDRPP